MTMGLPYAVKVREFLNRKSDYGVLENTALFRDG
jgi:hypothetical protein